MTRGDIVFVCKDNKLIRVKIVGPTTNPDKFWAVDFEFGGANLYNRSECYMTISDARCNGIKASVRKSMM